MAKTASTKSSADIRYSDIRERFQNNDDGTPLMAAGYVQELMERGFEIQQATCLVAHWALADGDFETGPDFSLEDARKHLERVVGLVSRVELAA